MAWSAPIEFGEWLPDQPQLSAPALRVALNVIPNECGYDLWPNSQVSNRGALDTFCRGASSGRTRQGTDFVVAGTTAKLWLATTGSFDDVTRTVGGAYAATKRWEFTLFGEDLVATDYDDAPQRYQFGASTDFALLHADAPRAKHVAVVREFVVFANLVGQGVHAAIYGTREDGVHWGGQGLANSWPTTGTAAAAAVQSDWQPIVDDGGQITDLVGGADYGIVFKERSAWRMDYEGGDVFFRFTQIDGNVGCLIPGSSIRLGGVTYFISETGLRRTSGGPSEPFGTGRVDQWLRDALNLSRAERVSTFVHPRLPVIGWAFMNGTATGDAMNAILLYNWSADRFSTVQIAAEWIIEALQSGASLDAAPYAAGNLDTTYGATDLDTITGGIERQLSMFTTTHELSIITGEPGGAVLETGDFELSPGGVAMVRALRPLYHRAGTSMIPFVKSRFRVRDAHTATQFSTEDADGKCVGLRSGRYHALRLLIFGDYGQVHGVSADFVQHGMR